MTDLGLSAAEIDIVQSILNKHVPGRAVFVFGSRATGRARRRSDLDLAIAGPEPLTLRLQGELREAFDESDLPIEVDVVDVALVSETFRKRIMSEWTEFVPERHDSSRQQEVHA